MLHREGNRKKLFPVLYLIRVLDLLKLKGQGLLPILPLQRLHNREEQQDFHPRALTTGLHHHATCREPSA